MKTELNKKFKWKKPKVSDFITKKGLTSYSIEPTIEVFSNGLLKIGFNVVGERIVENEKPEIIYSFFGEFMLKKGAVLSKEELYRVFKFVENQMWETELEDENGRRETLQDKMAIQGGRELTDEVIYEAIGDSDYAIYQLWDTDK